MTDSLHATRDVKSTKPTWGFYILWIVANAIGTILGLMAFLLLSVSLGFFGAPSPQGQQTNSQLVWALLIGLFIAAIPFGSLIGLMQWLVLRRHIPNSGFWILTSALAMFIGFAADIIASLYWVSQLPTLFLPWFVFGGVSGVLQWTILRRQRQLQNPGLWIVANLFAGAVAGLFMPDLGIIGGFLGWCLAGFLTAGTLSVLFRREQMRDDGHSIA